MLTGAERSKPKDDESQQGQKSPEPSCVAGRNVTRGSHHGKQRGPQVKPKNAVWPSHSAPAVCPREAKTCPHKTVYMKVYMAGSSQSCKQPEWPPSGRWIHRGRRQGPFLPHSASQGAVVRVLVLHHLPHAGGAHMTQSGLSRPFQIVPTWVLGANTLFILLDREL